MGIEQIECIENMVACVQTAGEIALDAQRNMSYADRGYKGDGSVITETDKRVEDYLFEHIARSFPGTNILTEETNRSFNPQKPYTFAIDPIDGTDVFSQGLAGWSVSVGLLDQNLAPIAGIVFVPRLELMIFADVGKPATLNGANIPVPHAAEPLSAKSNLMVPSNIHKQVDLRIYPGKIRSIGSAALHICFPVIYPGLLGAIAGPGGHIWDIAGAHAVIRSLGFDLEYINGTRVDYLSLTDGQALHDIVLAGSQASRHELEKVLVKL